MGGDRLRRSSLDRTAPHLLQSRSRFFVDAVANPARRILSMFDRCQVGRELARAHLCYLHPGRAANGFVGGDEDHLLPIAMLRCETLENGVGVRRVANLERPVPFLGADSVEDDDAARAAQRDVARQHVHELPPVFDPRRVEDVVAVEEIERPVSLRASYNSTAAATLTLSESTLPASGIETIPSHARRTSGRRPRPSAPSTNATPPSSSACQSCVAPSDEAPQTHRSGPFTSVRKRARFGTTATGRCSTAPADARETAGVTRADPCEGTTTPVAPAPSPLRTTAPRLCGSVTWSRHTSSGESTAASAYASA